MDPFDVMYTIEENQCGICEFKHDHGTSDGHDYLMCGEIEFALMEGDWPVALDKTNPDMVVCTRYRNETLAEQAHPDQLKLL